MKSFCLTFFVLVEINTMQIMDYESDNNGLVSENLIRLTPEEEQMGVFRYVFLLVLICQSKILNIFNDKQVYDRLTSNNFSPPPIGLPPKPVDCQATAWTEWTSCSKSCGTGWTTVSITDVRYHII